MLPKIGEKGYAQLSTFCAKGRYAGSCLRLDEDGPIMACNANMWALRVSDILPEPGQE